MIQWFVLLLMRGVFEKVKAIFSRSQCRVVSDGPDGGEKKHLGIFFSPSHLGIEKAYFYLYMTIDSFLIDDGNIKGAFIPLMFTPKANSVTLSLYLCRALEIC